VVCGSLRNKKSKSTLTSSGAQGYPSALHALDLSYCDLSKRGLKALIKVLLLTKKFSVIQLLLVQLSPNLQALHFSPLHTSFKITSTDFITLIQGCTNLVSLNLSTSQFEMDTILLEISKNCPKLNTLLLDGVGMTDYGLQNVTQRCSELQSLRFRYLSVLFV
jgi:hypothetical protein